MTIENLLDWLADESFSLALDGDDVLVTGRSEPSHHLLAALKQHKPALLARLRVGGLSPKINETHQAGIWIAPDLDDTDRFVLAMLDRERNA